MDTQHTDKFVIDDDDMESETATESNFYLRSRSFLNKVNDQLRKILDHSSKKTMQDIENVLYFGESLCLRHGKHLYSWERLTQTIGISSKIQEKSHLKTDVRHI